MTQSNNSGLSLEEILVSYGRWIVQSVKPENFGKDEKFLSHRETILAIEANYISREAVLGLLPEKKELAPNGMSERIGWNKCRDLMAKNIRGTERMIQVGDCLNPEHITNCEGVYESCMNFIKEDQ